MLNRPKRRVCHILSPCDGGDSDKEPPAAFKLRVPTVFCALEYYVLGKRLILFFSARNHLEYDFMIDKPAIKRNRPRLTLHVNETFILTILSMYLV